MSMRGYISMLARTNAICLWSIIMGDTCHIDKNMLETRQMNDETIEALRQVDEDVDLIEHETLEEFWEALGFNALD